MGEELHRLAKRRETFSRLRELANRGDTTLVIHYSCESFYDRPDGATPRVTSIAARNLESGQTESFSIHKIAELKHIGLAEVAPRYDELEREMLDQFFAFLAKHERCTWVHWNMRDINYGFQAIEHRYRVLGGIPQYAPPEERKFDLARAMVSLYGLTYAGHPRLENLIKKSDITDLGFLTGKQEADAFQNREFVKLHQSTLRKVDILANIFERALQRTLKTNAHWFESRGVHPKAIIELVTEHWAWSLITAIATIGGIIAWVV